MLESLQKEYKGAVGVALLNYCAVHSYFPGGLPSC